MSCIILNAYTLDYNVVFGFEGLYKGNSWSPLIVRISNDSKSISGDLIIEVNNYSTATEQNRLYAKPVDLPPGANKRISFILPIGQHSREIKIKFESGDLILFEDSINLKQKEIDGKFILGISPYPDLVFINDHKKKGLRTICYPHKDNLPGNSNAYASVDIVSIHRELLDKLTIIQYTALTEWVALGGVLVVWGGKSPAHSKWEILPSEIKGLKRFDSKIIPGYNNLSKSGENSILINIIETMNGEVLLNQNGFDLISKRDSGNGTVFFIAFDYSGTLRNWEGLDSIWDLIFGSVSKKDQFNIQMDQSFPAKKFASIFNNSSFTFIERINILLIFLLSISISTSILIFIRSRKKSKHLKIYITGLFVILLSTSICLYFSLYNSSFRIDNSIISINIFDHIFKSDKTILYKDILLGSSNKTKSDLIIKDDYKSVILLNDQEDLQIFNLPELYLPNYKMDQWSHKTLKFKSTVDSIISQEVTEFDDHVTIRINNISNYYIKDSFILYKGHLLSIGNILADSSIEKSISKDKKRNIINNNVYFKNPFINDIAQYYLNIAENYSEDGMIFCGSIDEEINPVEFSQKTWKKKTANLILFRYSLKGEILEKPSI